MCKDPTLQPHQTLSYTDAVLDSCRKVNSLIEKRGKVQLDGHTLDIGGVVVVARNGTAAEIALDPATRVRLQNSVDVLNQKLDEGETIYGVNTGFGGSADTRTADYVTLQKALIQHHNAAVLLPSDQGLPQKTAYLATDGLLSSHRMPIAVVRGALLARCNSLLRGHSAVRPRVVEYILALLRNHMTPVIPLRGSISASGDLTPLAYIAGVLEGNSDISVHVVRSGKTGEEVIPAPQALARLGLKPLDLGPKEGLGLMNGTAFSVAVASLVIFEANQLVLLSQVLTAMGTEALLGMVSNYHPFISATARPHEGQIEAAANIFQLLQGSKLATAAGVAHEGLAQDRYALRTASQWLAPQLETMKLALQQATTELNSTTDNPLLDSESRQVYHGGNFQAASITSAMEKTTSAMQMIGTMLFSQCSEILNPMLSKGLPPNLSIDDPSLSFAFKGIDINMAAYVSELGYLNNPLSNHVQSAEMHNQGINSLAFIASRYAGDAVEVLTLMVATYFYVLCQALDLRVLHAEFAADARPKVEALTAGFINSSSGESQQAIQACIWKALIHHWGHYSCSDLTDRCVSAANASVGELLDHLPASAGLSHDGLARQWKSSVSGILQRSYNEARERSLSQSTTQSYLCPASRIMYTYIRHELGVPIHKGIQDHPTVDREGRSQKQCIGSQVSKIYLALREGRFARLLLECWA
ncbi:L-Aspartase-like protein [Aspergillus pseudoustus]|uniref:L-Aspartase-like protein n=1 Tax=Aspergillus pseudoustus TaxID=1810923 RepID=A0ABR4KEG6_9EURO